MMKSVKILLVLLTLVIANYLIFDKVASHIIHSLQVVLGSASMVAFFLISQKLDKSYQAKNYLIPIIFVLVIIGRITESLFSLYLEMYYSNFYDKFPNAPFAMVIFITLIVAVIILTPIFLKKLINKPKAA